MLWVAALAVLALELPWVAAADGTMMSDADRIRIAEARRIADRFGDKIWPGWDSAPFAILLVTPDVEFLVYHADPTSDFKSIAFDSLLQSTVFARPRVFDTNLLATFPAVAGVPTIVIGQAKNTDASHSTRWVMTALHEHFHQWQQSEPSYYPATDSLGLADKDETGMWMLNYPFPYDSVQVNHVFLNLCRRLSEAVASLDDKSFAGKFEAYRKARIELRDALSEDDYNYFAFQVWQEGIARHTEYVLARRLGEVYRPTDAFTGLPDYVSFREDADTAEQHVLSELMRISLKKSRRVAFYNVGAAEGMLLDRKAPGWREHYFTHKFYIEDYFDLVGR
jgi:hypothetical protein